jgi:hypothetical protein
MQRAGRFRDVVNLGQCDKAAELAQIHGRNGNAKSRNEEHVHAEFLLRRRASGRLVESADYAAAAAR